MREADWIAAFSDKSPSGARATPNEAWEPHRHIPDITGPLSLRMRDREPTTTTPKTGTGIASAPAIVEPTYNPPLDDKPQKTN